MIKIEHTIHYAYSSEVFPEPHTIRLTPRKDFFQNVHSSEIIVYPEPVGLKGILGFEGNLVHTVWFQNKTKFLKIKSVSEILLKTYNPFDFLIHPPDATSLPVKYAPGYQLLTHHYLHHNISPEIKKFADDMIVKSGKNTVSFLIDLSMKIHSEFGYETRKDGESRTASDTFSLGSGACRDLTVLFIEICRYVGIASRFVSGYYIPTEITEKPDLHAWAEVYLPGAGWRGFDPTHGIAIYGRHIALASGILPEMAAPVTGSFLGDATSIITANLNVTEE